MNDFMKRIKLPGAITYLMLHFLLPSLTVFAQKSDNVELQKMYEEDQKARMASNIDWEQLTKKRQHPRKTSV